MYSYATAAFMTQTVPLEDHTVKFEIWDTAGPYGGQWFLSYVCAPPYCCHPERTGQERYRSLAPMYYRGAAAALVVFDLTDHVC